MSPAAWQVSGLAVLAAGLIAAAVWIVLQRRMTPDAHERRRRLYVNERGRLGDGTVTDVDPSVLYYSYAVSGVEYRASQDVTQLSNLLPPDRDHLVGPVKLKYELRNPVNSIVICETWSGLRVSSKENVAK